MSRHLLCSFIIMCTSFGVTRIAAQSSFDEDQLGAWYMYFFSGDFTEKSKLGFQGDIQYRNWNLLGDLEQLLIRGGISYTPHGTKMRLVLGYGNIRTGVMGDSKQTSIENRVYQEALIPQALGTGVSLTHRLRYEQRFVENQEFRTRFRYAIFVNIPLNKPTSGKGALYAALYDELFINGERSIGDGRQVELFDRNRLYLGLGYGINDYIRVQVGWMRQITDVWNKAQLQLSIHQNF